MVQIGKRAPEFRLFDTDKNLKTLDSYLGKNRLQVADRGDWCRLGRGLRRLRQRYLLKPMCSRRTSHTLVRVRFEVHAHCRATTGGE